MKDEELWMIAYRNYLGLYDSEVRFTDTEKSKAFVKITKTKILAAYAQIVDVLFAGSKFPISIEPRNYPNYVADSGYFDPNSLTDENVGEKVDVDYKVPRSIVRPDIARDLGVYQDRIQPIEAELEQGPGITKSAITFEPAKEAAQMVKKKMHD
jgi:hypothetical protein